MKIKYIFYIFILFAFSCKEKYISPVVSPKTGYLVVEGIVNSGAGNTNIVLSRTTPLDNLSVQYETGAQVIVEGEDNSTHALKEVTPGHYTVVSLNLNSTKKYRLNIATNDGKKYLSDFAAIQNNPAIDSLNWRIQDNGVQIFVNAHDPSNKAQYYQWEYDETWEIHSAYLSYLKYQIVKKTGGDIYSVVFSDSTRFSYDLGKYFCWRTEPSTQLLISSTATLSQDVVNVPLTYIPPSSWKLGVKYSINAKQYSLSKDGYEFLQRMKKNTEGTGSIFDAQPSELNGNIHCVSNPTEPVIGYVNICTVQEKRIFINSKEVPDWTYNPYCTQIEVPNNSDSIHIKAIDLLPTNYVKSNPMTGAIISFYAAPPDCVDCRLRGSNVKPAFWQ
jgi:predicted secreted protein